jgi:hypothetical protein
MEMEQMTVRLLAEMKTDIKTNREEMKADQKETLPKMENNIRGQ